MSEACRDCRLLARISKETPCYAAWPLQLHVDNAAGESFQHSTCGTSKLKGVYNPHGKQVQELKDKTRITAVHIDTKENSAGTLAKCLPAAVRGTLLSELGCAADSVPNATPIQGRVTRRVAFVFYKRAGILMCLLNAHGA